MIINKVSLKAELHPHPYKVSWINEVTLNVTRMCLISIEFAAYKNKIWCDAVIIDVG